MGKEDSFISPLEALLAFQEKGGPLLGIALSRGEELTFPFSLPISEDFEETYRSAKQALLTLFWMVGGTEVAFSCPKDLYVPLVQRMGKDDELRSTFVEMRNIYGKVVSFSLWDELPQGRARVYECAFSTSGCRIGLDLGGSDIKTIALKEGEVVYSAETPWDPRQAKDPSYHEAIITECLKKAASSLPRVDALGVSTSGIVEGNEILHPSLFASCLEETQKERVRLLFKRLIPSLFPSAPFLVVNDGDASALGGAFLYHKNSVLGLSLGTSLAAGYAEGSCLYPYLNELSKVRVNLSPEARSHYKYGIRGSASEYLSQKGLIALAESKGIVLEGSLPEKLLSLQKLAESKDNGVLRVYHEFGKRLGESVLYFNRFFSFANVFLLGRVMSGVGGEKILESASSVVDAHKGGIAFFTADERFKRLGQAYVAASLLK